MVNKIQDSPNVNWLNFKIQKNKSYSDVIKTFMGRDSLNIYLSNILQKKSVKTVLLPAYTCNEVTDQFKIYNYKIIYYDINEFIVNKDQILNIIQNNKIDVFYFIQYFGIVQKKIEEILNQIKKKSKSTLIIEDRAHYLYDKIKYKNVDAIIFSFRKLMSIPEGGGLLVQTPIKYILKKRIYSNLLVLLVILKKIIVGHNPRFSRSNIIKNKKNEDLKKDQKEVMDISTLSENIVSNFNISKHIRLRRNLFYTWLKVIKSTDFVPVFTQLEKDDIPLGFPIYVDNAELIHNKMTKENLYLKRHWPLNDEVKAIAPNSFDLSNKVITLPIYEGIEIKDIDNIITKLKKVK